MVRFPARITNYALLDRFSCLGADCEDTCCIGWGMQVDSERKKLYEQKAPELLDAITKANPNTPDLLVMKRDTKSDYCIKFEDGLCGIQKKYGENFLGDACHFFPRVTRNFGDTTIMAATLSCPEIARIALFSPDAFERSEQTIDRLPVTVKNYLPTSMQPEDALGVTRAFLDAANDATVKPEHALGRIISVSKSLDNIDTSRWKDAVPFLIRTADSRFPEPIEELADPYRLLHALAGLMAATKRTHHPRLMRVFTTIETALEAHIDWETIEITTKDTKLSAAKGLKALWDSHENETMRDIQRKWLQAELSMSSFPFAGLGKNVYERITIIAIRYATMKLALMGHLKLQGSLPDSHAVIETIQGLARFMDHLSDPELSLTIYSEAGWIRESRLFSLLGITNKINNKQSVNAYI